VAKKGRARIRMYMEKLNVQEAILMELEMKNRELPSHCVRQRHHIYNQINKTKKKIDEIKQLMEQAQAAV